jgi:hypothetical protein
MSTMIPVNLPPKNLQHRISMNPVLVREDFRVRCSAGYAVGFYLCDLGVC